MGGLAILLGAMVSLVLSISFQSWITMRYFFISLALMFIIGMRDDILALSLNKIIQPVFAGVDTGISGSHFS